MILTFYHSYFYICFLLLFLNRLMVDENLNPLEGDLIFSVVASISNLVVIHSMSSEVHRQFLSSVLQAVKRFPSSSHLTLAMNCAHSSLVFIWTERSIGNECDAECDRQINDIIFYVLERPSATESSETSEEVSLNEVCKLKFKHRLLKKLSGFEISTGRLGCNEKCYKKDHGRVPST
jgi:hypothetical protein